MFAIERSWIRRVPRRTLPPVALLLCLVGCGGDSVVKPPITNPSQAPVARVTAASSLGLVFVGFTQQVTAATFDAGGNVLTDRAVSWSSSDTNKATVNASGVVTGIAAGNVTVTATSEGQHGAIDLLVFLIDVDAVSVTPTAATMSIGGTHQLTGRSLSRTGAELTNRPVAWSSSDPSIATVTASGLVTAVSVGSVTITATREGKSASALITVVP